MKSIQTPGDSPLHQTVAEKIKFQSAGQSIQIEFTDQQLSPHAGTATFWSALKPLMGYGKEFWLIPARRRLPNRKAMARRRAEALAKADGSSFSGTKKPTSEWKWAREAT